VAPRVLGSGEAPIYTLSDSEAGADTVARPRVTNARTSHKNDMIVTPAKSAVIPSRELDFSDFQPDTPFLRAPAPAHAEPGPGTIHGVIARAIDTHSDERGSLCELLTTRDGSIDPIVHVYQVTAGAGAVRAWVFHRWQDDRLAFTQGQFRVVLYDIRPNSPTRHMLNVFVLGEERPTLLRLPAYVIHGVQNVGSAASTFVNMPTKAYEPGNPDKCRLEVHDRRIPFRFDE
jgi:dTDP-4-dehydrorhamnose 3,5-epimerase